MILSEQRYLDALKRIVAHTDYIFWVKSMRGISDYLDPWYDFKAMLRAVEQSASIHKTTLKLLYMGIDAPYDRLEEELGREDIALMVQSGIWRREGEWVKTNNLILFICHGLQILTEINLWYETCTNPNTDVYIGADSLRLAENIVFDKGATVLDLCSGTGIQGLLAACSASKVVSVELNPMAVPVTRFNIRLNGLESIIDLREGDLYNVLSPQERFDYIYANPPFIPMVDNVAYPLCGSGGEDGLMVLNRIFEGLPNRLQAGGKAVIFCECLGNDRQVFFYKEVEQLSKENHWRTNVLCANRIESSLQINRIAELTGLVNKENKGFQSGDLCKALSDVYKKLGATYLYSLVYQIHACGKGDGVLRCINHYNGWDAEDSAMVAEGLVLEQNTDSRAVVKNGRKIGALNNETVDILEQLQQGKTVRQAAEALWTKYRGRRKYAKYGYPAFLNSLLQACLQMEAIGAITCQKSSQ